jgi:uncharacterized DUF497 family protein
MEIEFELNGVLFRWNAEKEQSNTRKHDGITFKRAAQVFFDPFVIGDDASRNGEAREAAIGVDFDFRVLYVVHIEIEDDYIRIISARKAESPERKRYENGND